MIIKSLVPAVLLAFSINASAGGYGYNDPQSPTILKVSPSATSNANASAGANANLAAQLKQMQAQIASLTQANSQAINFNGTDQNEYRYKINQPAPLALNAVGSNFQCDQYFNIGGGNGNGNGLLSFPRSNPRCIKERVILFALTYGDQEAFNDAQYVIGQDIKELADTTRKKTEKPKKPLAGINVFNFDS